jgi:AraC family transcriptional regulator, positive regulator of tynA and feaB
MTQVWNTDAVAPGERFALWQDAVCHAVLHVATEQPPGTDFRARITSRTFGAMRFAAFKSSGHAIVRDPSHIRSLDDGGYLVSMQLRGCCNIAQGDQQVVLAPGEIAIIDGERPFRVAFPEHVERLVSVVPRCLLDARAPWITSAPVRKICGQPAIMDLARQHLMQLAQAQPDPHANDAALLAENLCNLLTIATAPEGSVRAMSADARLETLLLLARQNLADPDLSPAMLAVLCGISVRTLHLRFKQLGCTWREWVLTNRLAACKAALQDPRQSDLSISQVAYRWGFNDLSHFNKSFRRLFNMTPGECRHGVTRDGR